MVFYLFELDEPNYFYQVGGVYSTTIVLGPLYDNLFIFY